jgi:methylmalonyl-CoA mutase N-terminal domain/subunit
MMREEFGASDSSCRLRFHTQTGGSTLTAQQPLNNVVRVTVQALAAILGGTQSLHTNSYDEALALPTAAAVRLALRTQQILAEESGVASTADPLGGSWYVETLTAELESRAVEYLERVEELVEAGGEADVIAFMTEEIHLAAYRHQLAVESGERRVVGVNAYAEDDESAAHIELPDFGGLEAEQKRRLDRVRSERDADVVRERLAAVAVAADAEQNLLPSIVEAVRVRATIGEISGVLLEKWGRYEPV